MDFFTRLFRVLKALIFTVVAVLPVGLLYAIVKPIGEVALGPWIVIALNVVFALLLILLGYQGRILGGIAFILAVVIAALCSFLDLGDFRPAAVAVVRVGPPILLLLYILFYDALDEQGEYLGLYAGAAALIIGIILVLVNKDKVAKIAKFIAIIIYIIDAGAFALEKAPYFNPEPSLLFEGGYTPSHSSSSNYNKPTRTYDDTSSNDRTGGGHGKLQSKLNNHAPSSRAIYSNASATVEAHADVHSSKVVWTISIRGYKQGIMDAVRGCTSQSLAESYAGYFKSEVEREISNVKNRCESETSDAIESLRESYSDLDGAFSIEFRINQIS